MILPGLLDLVHPTAAGSVDRLQNGGQLVVGGRAISAAAQVGQRLQLPGGAGFALGIEHGVRQSQHVQQQAGPLFRRGGQQRLKALVHLGEDPAGRRQGLEPLRRPLEAKILAQQAGSGDSGIFQPFFDVVKRLQIHKNRLLNIAAGGCPPA